MSAFKDTSAALLQRSSKLVSTEACKVMVVRSKGVAVRIFSFTKYRLVLAIARQCNQYNHRKGGIDAGAVGSTGRLSPPSGQRLQLCADGE